jgi:1,4-dihydroxy-2-naphthoate polyprenyltransferase
MSTQGISRSAPPVRTFVTRAFAVVRLGRPIFLLGGLSLYGLGTLAAVRNGYAFELVPFLLGQLAVSAIQLMTHYANDYFDFEADRANLTPTRWSGGSRVLVNGELPRRVALHAALFVGAVAVVATIALLFTAGPTPPKLGAVLLLVLIQLLAWSYSGPPFKFHSRGLGEPTTALVVPFLTPLAGYVVVAGRVELLPMALSLPLCLLQIAMLLTIEFPDYEGDHTVGKSSWVVLLGPKRAAGLTATLIVGAFAAAFSGVWLGVPPGVALGWLGILPLGALQLVWLRRGDFRRRAAWEQLSFGAVALFFLAILVDLFALASAPGP